MPGTLAYVPARAGSERVPGKNLQPLAGHPLIAYAIASALECELFDAVVVSTDSEEIGDVARSYGAEVPCLRPAEHSTATSPDIDWVLHLTGVLKDEGRTVERFAILRPTSPFRSADTIRRAHAALLELGECADSIRAVERCRQHPGKMWVLDGDLMTPLLPQPGGETPLHSRQYQALPPVYAQNSSLEIAWRHVLNGPFPTISGTRVAPFLTDPVEGLSIDYPEDIARAEQLVDSGQATLSAVGSGPDRSGPTGPWV